MTIRIPARQKRDTSRFCGRFSYVSSLRLLQLSLFTLSFLQVSPASFIICPSSPAFPQTFLPSLLLYLSLSLHLVSLPPSLLSALRQTLCWRQPEPSSPLLFPGSLSLSLLCFYVSLSLRGPQPSLSLSLSLPLWVSPFPLHPPVPRSPSLSHTQTPKHNVLIFTLNTDTFRPICIPPSAQTHKSSDLFICTHKLV